MATYYNYTIKPVSEDDAELFRIVQGFSDLGSVDGFLFGEFLSVLEGLQKDGFPEKERKQIESIYHSFEQRIAEERNICNKLVALWEKRGCPEAPEYQARMKEKYDKLDEIKSEYYDR